MTSVFQWWFIIWRRFKQYLWPDLYFFVYFFLRRDLRLCKWFRIQFQWVDSLLVALLFHLFNWRWNIPIGLIQLLLLQLRILFNYQCKLWRLIVLLTSLLKIHCVRVGLPNHFFCLFILCGDSRRNHKVIPFILIKLCHNRRAFSTHFFSLLHS
jgi:hypothetical protein